MQICIEMSRFLSFLIFEVKFRRECSPGGTRCQNFKFSDPQLTVSRWRCFRLNIPFTRKGRSPIMLLLYKLSTSGNFRLSSSARNKSLKTLFDMLSVFKSGMNEIYDGMGLQSSNVGQCVKETKTG
uniref:Uncharacterized protein n=1 Tax=Kalanchoe fedtschenkoi TaxID=63787 RepID=A0A7N0TJC3_KALFE